MTTTRAFALLLPALLAAGCSDGDDDRPRELYAWAPMNPLFGGARQETGVVELDGTIYVLGGFDESLSIVADVTDVFDGPDHPVASLPVPMHHANVGVANGRIWVLGFLTGTGFLSDGRVFSYDPVANVWSEGPSMPLGTERGASGVAFDGSGDIYVIGGLRDGAAVADFSRFTAATTGTGGTWTGLTELPAPRDHMGAGMLDGIVYVAGGRSTLIGSHVPDLLAWSPSSPQWEARTPMPTSRGGVAAAVMRGEFFVIGGEGNPDDPSGVFPQVESYDPLTDEWTTRPKMLTPRHGTGAATWQVEGGHIVVPGGADQQAFGAVDVVEQLYLACPDCDGE